MINEEKSKRLTRKEASAFLKARGYPISTPTLDQYAWKGGGPVYEKFGRRVLYTEAGLLLWVASRTRVPQRHANKEVV